VVAILYRPRPLLSKQRGGGRRVSLPRRAFVTWYAVTVAVPLSNAADAHPAGSASVVLVMLEAMMKVVIVIIIDPDRADPGASSRRVAARRQAVGHSPTVLQPNG
jgi:hypothetical protein